MSLSNRVFAQREVVVFYSTLDVFRLGHVLFCKKKHPGPLDYVGRGTCSNI